MKWEDSIELYKPIKGGFDNNGNPIEEESSWISLGKCFISFNSSANRVTLADGSEYIYSYYVILPIRKAMYSYLPKEGDRVHITKKDGTINVEKEVTGFVTYKQRYLKIWL